MRHTRIILACCLVFWATGCTPAAAPEEKGKDHAATIPREDVAGVENFAQVSEGLYRGAQPTREGFLTLKRMGIKTVVSFRALHSDADLMAGTGMKMLRIPAFAPHPETEDMLKFLKVVEDPANQPVFVHCQYGSDRTGCAVAVYRMEVENWTAEAAMKELPVFGYHPIFTEIKDYLGKFDRAGVMKKLVGTKMPRLETP